MFKKAKLRNSYAVNTESENDIFMVFSAFFTSGIIEKRLDPEIKSSKKHR